MPPPNHRVSISVRLPRELVNRVDACVLNLRLMKRVDISPEDIHSGGRSAVIRVLLQAGLDSLQNRDPPQRQKRGAKSCPLAS